MSSNKIVPYSFGAVRSLYIPFFRFSFLVFAFRMLRSHCQFGWPVKIGRSILNAKTKNEFVFLFSYFTCENEKRKKEFVFVRKFENEKGISFSFANLKTKKEKTVYTRTLCSQV